MPNAEPCDLCGLTYHDSERCNRIAPRDRVFGAILGEAIGDAIGHPIEDKWAGTEDKKVFGLLEDNKFTDDTQMFCAIGEAMLESAPHLGEEFFMKVLSQKFIDWRNEPLGGSHRAPGGNCMEAVRKLGAGVPWRDAGGLDFKGNGTAMRSGIVGCLYWTKPELAFRYGALSSVLTHNNLEPILSAGVVAYLVASLIKGNDYTEAIANALLLCADYENRVLYPRKVPLGRRYHEQNPWYAISRFGAAFALGSSPNDNTLAAVHALQDHTSIVKDGGAVPAVAEAIFFSTKFRKFRDVVLNAANNSDDTDTIAAISGCICGSEVGLSNLPHQWVEGIELRSYLFSLAERIWDLSNTLGTLSTARILDSVTEADPILAESLLDDEIDEEAAYKGDIGVSEEEFDIEF